MTFLSPIRRAHPVVYMLGSDSDGDGEDDINSVDDPELFQALAESKAAYLKEQHQRLESCRETLIIERKRKSITITLDDEDIHEDDGDDSRQNSATPCSGAGDSRTTKEATEVICKENLAIKGKESIEHSPFESEGRNITREQKKPRREQEDDPNPVEPSFLCFANRNIHPLGDENQSLVVDEKMDTETMLRVPLKEQFDETGGGETNCTEGMENKCFTEPLLQESFRDVTQLARENLLLLEVVERMEFDNEENETQEEDFIKTPAETLANIFTESVSHRPSGAEMDHDDVGDYASGTYGFAKEPEKETSPYDDKVAARDIAGDWNEEEALPELKLSSPPSPNTNQEQTFHEDIESMIHVSKQRRSCNWLLKVSIAAVAFYGVLYAIDLYMPQEFEVTVEFPWL